MEYYIIPLEEGVPFYDNEIKYIFKQALKDDPDLKIQFMVITIQPLGIKKDSNDLFTACKT